MAITLSMDNMEGTDTMNTEEKQLSKMDDLIYMEGIKHFSAKEICTMRRVAPAVAIPPEKYWARIIPTLLLAEKIRKIVDCPLIVGNGYRPRDYNKAVGGSRNSQHIHFRALDLDLPKCHGIEGIVLQETFYEIACELFLSRGKELKMGLGLYRHNRGTRIHIDTGYSYRHWKKKYTKPLLERLR